MTSAEHFGRSSDALLHGAFAWAGGAAELRRDSALLQGRGAVGRGERSDCDLHGQAAKRKPDDIMKCLIDTG